MQQWPLTHCLVPNLPPVWTFVKDLSIPIIGVNSGRLGFLAKIQIDNIEQVIEEIISGKKEIARGGRYDDLLKSLGAKNNIPAVGAAINLNNIWKI